MAAGVTVVNTAQTLVAILAEMTGVVTEMTGAVAGMICAVAGMTDAKTCRNDRRELRRDGRHEPRQDYSERRAADAEATLEEWYMVSMGLQNAGDEFSDDGNYSWPSSMSKYPDNRRRPETISRVLH